MKRSVKRARLREVEEKIAALKAPSNQAATAELEEEEDIHS